MDKTEQCTCIRGVNYRDTTTTTAACDVHGDGKTTWVGDEYDASCLSYERLEFLEGRIAELEREMLEREMLEREMPQDTAAHLRTGNSA